MSKKSVQEIFDIRLSGVEVTEKHRNAIMQEIREDSMKPVITKRRSMTFILAAILLVATVATAATLLVQNVFERTLGNTPENAASLIQQNLAKETIGNAEITIKEAAYDGMTLYIMYGIRDTTATEPLGKMNEEEDAARLTDEDMKRIEALNVGWWWDNLWIDGKAVSMPSMSTMDDRPGTENGEALYYYMFRLDQESLFLSGEDVEIAMPIGEAQPYETLVRNAETDRMEKPEKGLVTFRLDCSTREQVRITEPNILMEGKYWNAKVSQVVYSPIQLYITLDYEISPEAWEAYIAETNEEVPEDFISELMNLRLVDKDGKPVFEGVRGFYGNGSVSDTQAFFTFPYAETYPDTMYLAPERNGKADMTWAIQVK